MTDHIHIKNAHENNLKHVDISLPKYKLIVFCGVSGSGKTSLAFDTIFHEGQRIFLNTFPSSNTLKKNIISKKPKVQSIDGLSPTIAITQQCCCYNLKTTIGSITEIDHQLRIVFAFASQCYCPISGEFLKAIKSKDQLIADILALEEKRYVFLAPINSDLSVTEKVQNLEQLGFTKVRINNTIYRIDELENKILFSKLPVELVIDRCILNEQNKNRIAESILTNLHFSDTIIVNDPEQNTDISFSTKYYSKKSNTYYQTLTPTDFSYSSKKSVCFKCSGMGIIKEFNLDLIIDENKSIKEDCCIVAEPYFLDSYKTIYEYLANIYDFSTSTPWKNLSEIAKTVFLYGTDSFPPANKSIKVLPWAGVLNELRDKYDQSHSSQFKMKIEQFMSSSTCPLCLGSKIKSYPSRAQFKGKTLLEIQSMTLEDAYAFFSSNEDEKQDLLISDALSIIKQKLSVLNDIGVGYLSLNRFVKTLSGGELQRVRIAHSVNNSLTDMTYIIDEPSKGLHPSDNTKLMQALISLRDAGNTVIVVEHNEDIILNADLIIEIGPKSGRFGGEITFKGTPSELLEAKNSITAKYLHSPCKITKKTKKVISELPYISIEGASLNNLKNVSLEIPMHCLVAFTGISGSGKTSLVINTLFPVLHSSKHHYKISKDHFDYISGDYLIDDVVSIDQSQIGSNAKSNPSTYMGLFNDIRNIFVKSSVANNQKLNSKCFTVNSSEGNCPNCKGSGVIKTKSHLLENQSILCTECHGKRFNSKVLSIKFKGYNINDVLNMTVNDAASIFKDYPNITNKLDLLIKVGLGYLTLEQPSSSLSGGEAQRMKIAKELSKKTTGHILYILDEPTTGLHSNEITLLLNVLNTLVELGNTVFIIEHNSHVINSVDCVVDLGPTGGPSGGYLLFQGTPEELAKEDSKTGSAARKALEPNDKNSLITTYKNINIDLNNIIISGASQNNLQKIDVSIPKLASTVVCGPAKSGKKSLILQTIYCETIRKYASSLSNHLKQFLIIPEKPIYSSMSGLMPTILCSNSFCNQNNDVSEASEFTEYLRLLFATVTCLSSLEEKEHLVNNLENISANIIQRFENQSISICYEFPRYQDETDDLFLHRLRSHGLLKVVADNKVIYIDDLTEDYLDSIEGLVLGQLTITESSSIAIVECLSYIVNIKQDHILIFDDNKQLSALDLNLQNSSFNLSQKHFSQSSSEGRCLYCHGKGITKEIGENSKKSIEHVCSQCEGSGLNSIARSIKLNGCSIYDVLSKTVSEAITFFQELEYNTHNVCKEIIDNIKYILSIFESIGLKDIPMNREVSLLSFGENKKLYIASKLAKKSSNTLYIFEDPTFGLHGKDSDDVLNVLNTACKNLKNTIIHISNDSKVIKSSDNILELDNGSIVKDSEFVKELLTETKIDYSKRKASSFCNITDVYPYGDVPFEISIPLNCISTITGATGTGKSYLMKKTLKPKLSKLSLNNDSLFHKVVYSEQEILTCYLKSDVGTITNILPALRKVFTQTKTAQAKGLGLNHFNSSHSLGMCSECKGAGFISYDITKISCSVCSGLRLNSVSLQAEFKNLNFGQILNSTVDELIPIFQHHVIPNSVLTTMSALGLGHIKIGTNASLLSYGEIQRIKLSRSLSCNASNILYLLDNPFLYLEKEEIGALISLFNKMIENNNTIVLIDNKQEVLDQSDYVFEITKNSIKEI